MTALAASQPALRGEHLPRHLDATKTFRQARRSGSFRWSLKLLGQSQDTVLFEKVGITQDGKVIGRFRATGLRPRFIDKIEASGIRLPPNIFGIGQRSNR